MTNKEQIEKLKDNAELAWASYGYFDLVGKEFETKATKQVGREKNPTITLTDILNMDYKGYETSDSTFFNTHELKGDFSITQAKRFFERYTLLKHCPNTASGFSATLFQHKKSKELTLAIRGTEFSLNRIEDLITDYYIGTNNNDTNMVIEQYFDMLIFYEERIKAILKEKG
ncbi:alpha/beta fold hydrolase, partial [Helicobacter sp. T3_23-1059]